MAKKTTVADFQAGTNTLEASLEEAMTPEDTDDPFGPIIKTDAFGSYPGPALDPVRVTDYDARGEAVDHDAVTFTQAELPNMPAPVEPLWPRIDGHLVGKVRLAISGNVELDGGDEALALALSLGESVQLMVECNIDGKAFTLIRKKGHKVGLMGSAVLKVVAATLVDHGELEEEFE